MITWLQERIRQIRFWFLDRHSQDDLVEEMQLHLSLRAEEEAARGVSMESAAAAARRKFGNVTRLQEMSREAWGWTVLDSVTQDLRYATRSLLASPSFTATAVLSLALGIGANTGIFGIVNAVLLRTLPVEDPAKLVEVGLGQAEGEVSTPIWEALRDYRQDVFSGMLAYSSDRFDLSTGGESRFARGMWVSGDFFNVLGVPVVQGRPLTAADDRWGGGADGPVAVVSYRFWQSNYPDAVVTDGHTVTLNRRKFTIVGVTPPWFTGLDTDYAYDIAIPIGCQPVLTPDLKQADERFHWWLRVVGRLPDGVTLEAARQRIAILENEIFRIASHGEAAQAEQSAPKLHLQSAALGFSATRVQYRTALHVLMALVGVVLLIACANIANLLLVRGASRHKELSVRMAIGASRRRVLRQLMTESLLLALASAAIGLLLGLWISRILVSLIFTEGRPIELDVSLDGRVLGFTVCASLITALLFGLAPSLRATGHSPNSLLKATDRSTVRGFSRFQLGKALLITQVALSFVLLAGAGLFLGSLRNLMSVDLGFQPSGILLVGVNVGQAVEQKSRHNQTHLTIADQLRRLPKVESIAYSALTPIRPEGWAQTAYPEGYTVRSPRETQLFLNQVSSEYFKVLQTPVVLGRPFNESDTSSTQPVIVINESAARRFFKSGSPIGKSIGVDRPGPGKQERIQYRVVGVVKDTKYNRVNENWRPIGYLFTGQEQALSSSLRFSVRTSGEVSDLIPAVRSTIANIDPRIGLEFRSFETQISESLAQQRLIATLSTAFGFLAISLAVVGLYGTTAYSFARRKAEIGVRIALGAQTSAVLWLMLRDVAALLSVGVVTGLAVVFAVGRLIENLLFGVRSSDPWQLILAGTVLCLVAGAAAFVPARRATRLDPVAALRQD